jgi:hypothetical protein
LDDVQIRSWTLTELIPTLFTSQRSAPKITFFNEVKNLSSEEKSTGQKMLDDEHKGPFPLKKE